MRAKSSRRRRSTRLRRELCRPFRPPGKPRRFVVPSPESTTRTVSADGHLERVVRLRRHDRPAGAQGAAESNDYVAVIQSVIEGQGIALGWGHLTDGLVEKGVLLRLTDHHLATGKTSMSPGRATMPLSPAAMKVRDLSDRPAQSVGAAFFLVDAARGPLARWRIRLLCSYAHPPAPRDHGHQDRRRRGHRTPPASVVKELDQKTRSDAGARRVENRPLQVAG